MSTYTNSQWGLAQFTLPKEGHCVCAFSDNKSAVGMLLNVALSSLVVDGVWAVVWELKWHQYLSSLLPSFDDIRNI